jgi:rhodanese-related sulfurtransferase
MQHSPKFLQIVNEARAKVRECSIEDLKAVLDSGSRVLVFDTREDHEWANGHIPGAIHLSKGIVERDIERVVTDPTETLYLYCGGGYRSALVAENLQRMGYTGSISVDGGFRAWKEKGFDIHAGS